MKKYIVISLINVFFITVTCKNENSPKESTEKVVAEHVDTPVQLYLVNS